MVFARNVARLVRPAVLGRCIVPRSSGCPVLSVASFPSMVPVRNAHSATELDPASKSAAGSTAAFSESAPLRTSGASTPPMDALAEEASALTSVPTEKLVESFHSLLKQAKLAPMSSFEEIFKALCVQREFMVGMDLVKEMRASDLKPSSLIYSLVARSGRRALRSREIRVLFGEELASRLNVNGGSSTSTSTSMPASSEEHESPLFVPMRELLEMMRTDGAELNHSFYDDLAFGLAMNQQGGLLINVAIAMEKRGLQPSTYYYNKMLYALPRCGLADRADVLFSRMILNNLADQSSYTVRIGSLVYLGRVGEAENCFKDMSKLYGANEVACNSIIHGYLNERRLDDALEVLETMKGTPQCRPNNITANTFVSYYFSTGDLVSAPAVLEYFATAIAYPAQSRDYANLLKLFARNDQTRAQKMLETLQTKGGSLFDVDVYNAVLQCISDRQVLLSFRQKMVNILIPEPLPIAGDSLAALCINTTTEFRQTVAKMEQAGIVPNGNTFDLVLKAVRARNDHDAAIQVFRRIPLTLLQNTHRNHYLAALISKGAVEEIKMHVKSMNDRRQPIFDFNVSSLSHLGIEVGTNRARVPPRRSQAASGTGHGVGSGSGAAADKEVSHRTHADKW